MPVFGLSTDLGRRKSQQDAFIAVEVVLDGEPAQIFAVFDGHGSDGAKCAQECTNSLVPLLQQHYNSQDPTQWLTSVFAALHESLLSNTTLDAYMSGTTCSVVIQMKNRIIVGGVGDSKVVLATKNSSGVFVAEQLTTDHNCNSSPELRRIIQCGGRVERLRYDNEETGPLRIFKGTLPYPGIVITRSLGDSVATKLGVLCEPDVISRNLSNPDAFIIIASDGVWDAFQKIEEVIDIVAPYYLRYQGQQEPQIMGPSSIAQEASIELTKASLEALDRQQLDDNITNIVVLLS